MSMNLIAILVSLAMMLTGAGQTEALPAARTLTLSNVNVTWNGEALRLGPQAHIGVSTDGGKAVYDFGAELDGRKLMPVQVVADETGITALSGNSGVAIKVTAEALAGLTRQLEEQVNATIAESGYDSAEMMRFITEEYMPAYMNVLKVALDPEQRDGINTASQVVFDRMVDRGEGTPATLEVDGESYGVTAYSYSIDAMQMAALSDAIYAEVPVVKDYYDALFKLYAMLPEESGLRGLDSFTALFEKFGVQVRLDIEEQRSEDGAVDEMEGVLTMDMNSMVNSAQPAVEAADGATETPPETEATEAPVGEAPAADEAAEAPAIEPIVMNLHSLKLPDYSETTVGCSYAIDAQHGVEYTMLATETVGGQELEVAVFLSEDGRRTHGGRLTAFKTLEESGSTGYSVNFRGIQQDTASVSATVYGTLNPDGTSQNSVEFDARADGVNLEVSFDLNVTGDAIEDVASGVAPACVIDDLSEESIQNMGQNPGLVGAGMQAIGSLMNDADALTKDPGVKSLMTLVRGDPLPIDVAALDEPDPGDGVEFSLEPEGDDGAFDYVIDAGDDLGIDFDEMSVEDDSVLAFAEPRLTWLPKGWTVTTTETDTAYDWVELGISDADGAECAYAIFFLDPEASATNYIVQENGKVVDGRLINVTDFGEGGLSVTVSENGMYGNLMFTSEAIELDTIGRIVAGIQF